MKSLSFPVLTMLALAGLLGLSPLRAVAGETVEMSGNVPLAADIQEGLFPDDECGQLKAAGFKCMGFKPAVKYSLPAVAFKAGSAELPEQLKQQLNAFAEVLKNRTTTAQKIRVEGHADASGTPAVNLELSQRRAEMAKQYLVEKGVQPELLLAVGVGAAEPKAGTNPQSPENRRVVIGRDVEPGSR